MDATSLSDLHRHLDGSMRLDTLRELAAIAGIEVPDDIRFYPNMGLSAALERFAVTVGALQSPDAVKRVAAEMCQDAAAEGVTTLEIRFAPQLHQGADLATIVDAAIDGARGRAGIVLCALYGDPPQLVQSLVDIGRSRDGVVGIDIAGSASSGHDHRLHDYSEAFTRARDVGLGRTVHAGEGHPPEQIRIAIEHLHAQRIGHGTTLLDDRRVLDLVLEREVTIEACPTSNVHTGVIDNVAAHPIARWLDAGVRVCVCADNTLFSDVDARSELTQIATIHGMSGTDVARVIDHGHAAAFGR